MWEKRGEVEVEIERENPVKDEILCVAYVCGCD